MKSIALPNTYRQIIFIGLIVLCTTPFISTPVALLLGIVLAQTIGHPFIHLNNKATKILLKVAVVGLGFGMNLQAAIASSKQGVLLAIGTITITLTAGILLGKFLKVKKNTRLLIASGTAICGGSAIAAVSPVLKANEEEMSVSLGTVFILNAIALFLFPYIGHLLHMTQNHFGMWAAVAIHDTSSVVAAGQVYGHDALQTAITVKLARSLWIIPLVFLMMFLTKNKKSKVKLPLFILGFILTMIINTYVPSLSSVNHILSNLAKKILTITLFLIGAGLTRERIKAVGFKPLMLGITLWTIISLVSLFAVQNIF